MVVERLSARWRVLLLLSLATGATASTTFTSVAVVNSLVFGYDFFDESAPTDRAELAATVSLITLVVLGAALAVIAYGALVHVADESTIGMTVRRAAHSAWRDAWFAVPLMVICGLAMVFVVPAFAVGPLAAIATQRVTGRRARPGYVGRSLGRHLLAAAAPATSVALLWVLAAVASFAPVPPLPSPVIAWIVVFVVSVVVALGVSVTATASVVYLGQATRPAPWPPPVVTPWQGQFPSPWVDPWPQRPASVPVPRQRVVAGILIGIAVGLFWFVSLVSPAVIDPEGGFRTSGSATWDAVLGGALLLAGLLVVVAVVLIAKSRSTRDRR